MSNTVLGILKYSADLYVGSGFFDIDMDGECVRRNESLVRCTRKHECIGAMKSCKKIIEPRTYALRVTSLFRGEGFKSQYVCTNCIEEWLEESGQAESEDLTNGSQQDAR